MQRPVFKKLVLLVVSLILLGWVVSGCAVFDIRRQSAEISHAGLIEGTVANRSAAKGPVIVCLFKVAGNVYSLVDAMQIGQRGEYRFWRQPGNYYVFSFVDVNGDNQFAENEPWSYYGKPDIIALASDQIVKLDNLIITDVSPTMPTSVHYENRLGPTSRNFGVVASLDDQRLFSVENYSMGMWRPIDFLERVGGGGFFLEQYDRSRIPVLFFHGINGGPTDFRQIINGMDRTRFQPLMIYYPSGLKLDIVSNYLVSGVASIQNRYGFKRFIIAAHSMGGLVARSFVRRYLQQYPNRSNYLAGMITINSPLSGMPSASYGAVSPVVVQSWLDLVPGSQFLQTINNWNWPVDIPYYLIFSYGSGSSDGVVPLEQQLPMKQQLEAARVYGFNNSHMGTLSDPGFIRLFNTILSSHNRSARRVSNVAAGDGL